jgi:predicted DNA-binding transcriptional regulator YafY
VRETPVGSDEWLVGEILSFRGDAVLLEPKELRPRIAERAAELEEELDRVKVTG